MITEFLKSLIVGALALGSFYGFIYLVVAHPNFHKVIVVGSITAMAITFCMGIGFMIRQFLEMAFPPWRRR